MAKVGNSFFMFGKTRPVRGREIRTEIKMNEER